MKLSQRIAYLFACSSIALVLVACGGADSERSSEPATNTGALSTSYDVGVATSQKTDWGIDANLTDHTQQMIIATLQWDAQRQMANFTLADGSFNQEIALDATTSLQITNDTVAGLTQAVNEARAGQEADYLLGCYCLWDSHIDDLRCCCVWSSFCAT